VPQAGVLVVACRGQGLAVRRKSDRGYRAGVRLQNGRLPRRAGGEVPEPHAPVATGCRERLAVRRKPQIDNEILGPAQHGDQLVRLALEAQVSRDGVRVESVKSKEKSGPRGLLLLAAAGAKDEVRCSRENPEQEHRGTHPEPAATSPARGDGGFGF